MKKILSIIMLLFILTPCIARADQPKKYWGQVITSDITVGQTISFEIGPNSDSESVYDLASGKSYIAPEYLKDAIAHEVNGTISYDPNVLEYIDVKISEKGGCCYYPEKPIIDFQTGNIKISWDSENGNSWGFYDTIFVNFKVKSAPSNNQTEIKFIPTQGGETYEVKKTLTVNGNDKNTENNNENDNVDKENINQTLENKDNSSNSNILIIVLTATNLILLLTIVIILISNNKKKQ